MANSLNESPFRKVTRGRRLILVVLRSRRQLAGWNQLPPPRHRSDPTGRRACGVERDVAAARRKPHQVPVGELTGRDLLTLQQGDQQLVQCGAAGFLLIETEEELQDRVGLLLGK